MGIKKNFFYSSFLTVSNYIFPLIVFPYTSRVLGVTSIGICNFVDSVINYYILFSMMGISVIGIREIAKSSINCDIDRTFSSLFVLNLITTFFVLIVFVISLFCIPQLYQHKELMYIGGIKILFNLFLIEWFYGGIENFRFITIRSLFVKILYVIAIFLFIHHESDYIIYYGIMIGTIVVNAIINWVYSRNYVHFSFKNISIIKYIRQYLINGFYLLLTSMYTSFNVAYLGFVSGEKQVGYYTTAIKLFTIFLGIFTAFTNVMMPRMSALISEGKNEDIKYYMNKSFDSLFAFSLPIIFITSSLSAEIIYIIAGVGYEGAIVPMIIVMPLILIVGIAQILIVQVLIPAGYDKAVLFNSVIGAVVGILMNIFLVKYYASIGSALVVLIAEIVVTVSAMFWIKKYFQFLIPYKKFLINILLSIPYVFICVCSQNIFNSVFLVSLSAGIFSLFYFIISQLFILKNEIVIVTIEKIKIYFIKR